MAGETFLLATLRGLRLARGKLSLAFARDAREELAALRSQRWRRHRQSKL